MSDAKGRKQLYQNASKLAEFVGFPSSTELNEWMQSGLVQSHWQFYYTNWLQNQQASKGSQRTKGPELQQLIKHLVQGEADGKQKFSAYAPNTTGWNEYDWQALLLLQLNYHNTRNAKGPFYGKNLSDNEKYDRLHAVIKRLTRQGAPARQSKTQPHLSATPGSSSAEQENDAAEVDSEEEIDMVNKKGGQVNAVCPEGDMPDHWANECDKNETLMSDFCKRCPSMQALTEEIESAFKLRSYALEVAGVRHEDTFLNDDAYHGFLRLVGKSRFAVQVTFIVRDSPPESVLREKPADALPVAEHGGERVAGSVDAFRLMCEERGKDGDEGNVQLRFWRWRALYHTATMYDGKAGAVLDSSKMPEQDNEDEDAQYDSNWAHFRELRNETQSNIDHDGEDSMELSKPKALFPEVDAATQVELKRMESWLDNQELQRQDHTASCTFLGIQDEAKPRLAGMASTFVLKFWQPVAIAGLIRIEDRPAAAKMHSAMLCDGVGLGKTTVIGSVVLYRVQQRRSTEDEAQRNSLYGLPKPTIYVTLPTLVAQVASELRVNFPALRVLVYHSGTTSVPKGDCIDNLLPKDDIFKTSEEGNAAVVVVTSYGMMRTRHGPAAQREYRKQKLMRTKGKNASAAAQAAEDDFYVLDQDWPESLADKFIRLVCDESHEIGNAQTQQWTALAWLRTKYKSLMTATPFAPSEDAFEGQLRLMQSNDAWGAANLARLGVDSTFDPWSVSEDHVAAELRFTAQSVRENIINDTELSDADKGNRFRSIMKRLVIRRTAGSRIPFGTGKTIGEDIPPVKYTTARCTLTNDEHDEYNRILNKMSDREYMKTLREKDKSMWTPAFRRMMLVCDSLKFEHMLDLKLGRLKTLRNEGKVTALQLLKHCLDKQGMRPSFELPDANDPKAILMEHARGSPKLRFLLFIAAELVVLKQEKMTVWCALPSTQQWIESVLQEAGVKAKSYRADMAAKEKEELQRQFNDTEDIEVLILPYRGASCGLNLQKMCRNMCMFDPAPNTELGQQAVGRHHRVGQTKVVRCIRLYLQGGWDEKQGDAQVKRSLVSLMTQLSSKMLDDGDGENESITDLVFDNGVLKNKNDPNLGTSPQPLSVDEYLLVVRLILLGEEPRIIYGYGVKPKKETKLAFDGDLLEAAFSSNVEREEASTKKIKTDITCDNIIDFFKTPAKAYLGETLNAQEKILALEKLSMLRPQLQENDAEKEAVKYIAQTLQLATIINKARKDTDRRVRERALAMAIWWAAATKEG